MHNHLGQVVETTGQINEFLSRCPDCGLILDTGHLVAAGGDPVEMINAHADRLVAVHVKDWLVTDPDIGLDQWTRRGRFCELGGGNSGQDHHAVIQALRQTGYAGWVFVEHDTHVSDPLAELAISRDYLRQSGI